MAKENETIADIIAEMRFHGQQNIEAKKDKPEYGILTMEGWITQDYADSLEAAYRREVDALKQRCNELNAEVAAKDEVIKRLNDALAEEQRRKMATAEKSSAVGGCAKLREADSIHRAMVILAGIEMPDHDYPPKLWTALEDAYDALSDALGTDGDTTADEEEARANGRHFVIQPRGDCAKLREALVSVKKSIDDMGAASLNGDPEVLLMSLTQVCARLSARIDSALAAPPRNCDVYDNESCRMAYHLHGDGLMTMQAFADWLYAPATEKDGGAK